MSDRPINSTAVIVALTLLIALAAVAAVLGVLTT